MPWGHDLCELQVMSFVSGGGGLPMMETASFLLVAVALIAVLFR